MPQFNRILLPWMIALGGLVIPLRGEAPPGREENSALTQQEEIRPWGEKETRLAGIYLEALQAEPAYGHMLDLLWQLYQRHGATADLLESLRAQAAAGNFPVACLIHGHLLRKSGDLPAAMAAYDALLADAEKAALTDAQGKPLLPLVQRARAEIAVETGDEAGAVMLYEKLLHATADGDPEKIALLVELGKRHAATQNAASAWAAWRRALELAAYEPSLTQNIAQRLLAAGQTAECLALYERLAADPLPEHRFAALEEIARLHELQEDFSKANAALVQAQAMTHFRDARHEELLRRRVRLCEHFDRLPELERELVAAAQAVPAEEKALMDAARFFALTVRAEQRLAWLRRLAALVPSNPDYRADLIDTLLQLDEETEAASMLDVLLAQPGNDTFAWVQKRAELEARQGRLPAVEARLRRWLSARPNDAAAAGQALNYARSRRLDALAEEILRQNIAAQREEIAPVMELAGFLLERNRPDDMLKELKSWVAAAADPKVSRERNQRAALFLSGRDRRDMGESFARAALQTTGAGTGESLLLAEVMFREGRVPEAVATCEQAWQLAGDEGQRREADEKLLAILSGNQPPPPPAAPPASTAPLGGFGQAPPAQPPPSPRDTIPVPVRDYARQLRQRTDPETADDAAQLFRAAWWAARAREDETALHYLQRLRQVAADRQTPLSLPAEKLLLELAEATQNHALVQRQIDALLILEPANRDEFLRRLAASCITGGERERGETILRDIHHRQPGMTGIAEALVRSYRESGRFNEAILLWEDMLRTASPAAARQLLRPYTQALAEAGRQPEAFAAYLGVIPREKDPRARLEMLEEQLRFLPRNDLPGSNPGGSDPKALESALTSYAALASAHPFDPFYHEALARVYEMKGDAAAAFAELKRGYYLSRSPAQNLPRLRAAAVKAEDQEAAVYFQKQILAQNPAQQGEGEWRTLVELLENNFRIDEADATRRRMERQFSQDADILERIARHYEEAQQFEDALRLRKALVSLRKGDLTILWAYVRLELNEGDPALAEPLLDEVLLLTQNAAEPHRADDDRMPFPPLLLGFDDQNQNPGEWRKWAETVTQMTSQKEKIQIGPLAAWLNLPHAYLQEDSLEGYAIRLHTLKAKAKILAARGGEDLAAWIARWKMNDPAVGTVSMRLWALGYAGAKREMLDVLEQHMAGHKDVRTRFLLALLSLSNGDGERALAVRDSANFHADFLAFEQAFGCLSDSGFRFSMETMVPLISNPRLPLPFAFRFTFGAIGQPFAQVQTMAAALMKRGETFRPFILLELSQAAQKAGLWAEEESYLKSYFDGQLVAGNPGPADRWALFRVVGRYIKLLPPDAQPAFCQRVQSWAESLPASRENRILLADLAEFQGQRAEAERLAWEGVASSFTLRVSNASREKEPQMEAKLASGVSQPSHQEFWREADKALSYLLPALALKTGRRMEAELGPLYHGPDECAEYTLFALNQLERELNAASWLERLHLTRQALARASTAEETLNLALHLEKLHYKQEAVLVLEDLTHRAPANSQYAETLLKLCRESGDTAAGLRYLDRLFSGEIPQPPPGLSDEEMYRAHAVFLRLTDVGQLNVAAYLHSVPPPKTEPWPRPPADIHYLRELIAHLQEEKRDEEALLAIERLSAFAPTDGLLCLQHAELLEKTGRKTEAMARLRRNLDHDYSDFEHKAAMHSQLFRLLLEAGERKPALALLPVIMRNVNLNPRHIIAAADVLARHYGMEEARAMLGRARRQAKEEFARARYGASLLHLEIEASQGQLKDSLPTLNLLLRANSLEAESLQQFVQALQCLPAHQCPIWSAFFQSQAQRSMHPSTAIFGAILLADHPEEISRLLQPLLNNRFYGAETPAMLDTAMQKLMEAGQWEKSKIILDAIPQMPQPRENFQEFWEAKLRYSKARKDALMRQEVLKSLRMTENTKDVAYFLEAGPSFADDPAFFAELAGQLVEQIFPQERESEKTELCLRAFLRAGDASAARQLLQEQLRILSPEAAVQALLDVAEARGRLADFEQDLANYQPTDGIRAAALRAWRLRK